MSASNAALVGDLRDHKPTPSANVPSAIDPVTPETAVIVSEPAPEVDQRKPAKKVARVLLLGFAAIMATHVATDLMAPSSTTGQVAAYTTMITPRVNGQVDKIDVQDNQKVKAGDVLFELDPRPFDLALRQAEVALEQATRSLASSSASLEAAQAKITQAKISLENTRANTERTRDMFSRGLSSQSVLDSANAQLASAEAGLDAAELDYQSAVIQLGETGANNPQLMGAAVQLEQAQLNKAFSVVTAPSDGVVSNMKLSVGQYLSVGASALTFIASEQPWVSADFRENQLVNITAGDEVSLVFDAAPGRVYRGVVSGVAWGIDPGRTSANGLPQNQSMTRWFEPARTIPVRIEPAPGEQWPANTRVGSKVSALVYSGGANNPVGWYAGGMQRLQSFLSYLY
ncbi:MAG TPA: HlyD family secretion protein [Devosia sp.]|nr:HlyD family secretion protein [Devosia sp.]